MKRLEHLLRIVLIFGWCLFTSCSRNSVPPSGQGVQKHAEPHWNIDWEKVEKENEERTRNPHPSDWPFPNFEGGRPGSKYVPFYGIDDRFPSYLLCEYTVREVHYDQTKESGWFKDALEQTRGFGPKKFPPLKWVAVIVSNETEHRDASTFEQSFKVGAIFDAKQVFEPRQDLSQLVARAEMDRHPFMYDRQQPTPGEQQRWLIVERHAKPPQPPPAK